MKTLREELEVYAASNRVAAARARAVADQIAVDVQEKSPWSEADTCARVRTYVADQLEVYLKQCPDQGGWSDKAPTSEGWYLFLGKDDCNTPRAYHVAKGRWENSRNPEWFYASTTFQGVPPTLPINDWAGLWFGPVSIPVPTVNVKMTEQKLDSGRKVYIGSVAPAQEESKPEPQQLARTTEDKLRNLRDVLQRTANGTHEPSEFTRNLCLRYMAEQSNDTAEAQAYRKLDDKNLAIAVLAHLHLGLPYQGPSLDTLRKVACKVYQFSHSEKEACLAALGRIFSPHRLNVLASGGDSVIARAVIRNLERLYC